MRRRKENEHFSTINCPLGTFVHRGTESTHTAAQEGVVQPSPFTGEKTEAKRKAARPAPQPRGRCQDSSSDLPPSSAPVLSTSSG